MSLATSLLILIISNLVASQEAPETPPATSDPPQKQKEEPASPTGDAKEVEQSEHPQRVHLILNRREEISGWRVREDEHVIVVRPVFAGSDETAMPAEDPANPDQTIHKNRAIALVRLNDMKDGQTPGMVFMRDGTVYEGTVFADTFDHVHIRVEGIDLDLPRKRVSHVQLDLPFKKKYQQIKESLEPTMYGRRLELCRWLVRQREYELAHEELTALVKEVDLYEANMLLNQVDAQLKMNEEADVPGVRISGSESGNGTISQSDLLPTNLLSTDDVNIIRVYEIDFSRPPRVSISPETIRDLITEYAADPRIPSSSEGRTKLFRADPLELVKLIFQLQARDFYPRISVDSEPYSLNLFRQRVHDSWLINNCATSKCHGGVKAGDLFLHRKGYKDPRVRYTNMMILLETDLSEHHLVDFENPMKSLIIQHALPRSEARLPHPDVKGWRPSFGRSNKRLLEDSIQWINSMYKPRHEYPIDFTAPEFKAPTAPAGDGNIPADGGTQQRQTR